jgi:hypothetical protein
MPYIILDLSRSTANRPVFWKADDHGYIDVPMLAGIYDTMKVLENWNYYNDGVETLAVPVTYEGLEKIGFKCTIDPDMIRKLMDTEKKW